MPPASKRYVQCRLGTVGDPRLGGAAGVETVDVDATMGMRWAADDNAHPSRAERSAE